MPYIDTKNDIPGIRSLMSYRPETGSVLNQFAQVLLADDASLSKNERELIAAFVSSGNQCRFCMGTHAAIAAHHEGGSEELSKAICTDFENAAISDKMKSLLRIADKVRVSGRLVTPQDVADARNQGANDADIHDTVLIAAAFCMFNRYVDGLGATTPDDPGFYRQVGEQRAREGYLTKSFLVSDSA